MALLPPVPSSGVLDVDDLNNLDLSEFVELLASEAAILPPPVDIGGGGGGGVTHAHQDSEKEKEEEDDDDESCGALNDDDSALAALLFAGDGETPRNDGVAAVDDAPPDVVDTKLTKDSLNSGVKRERSWADHCQLSDDATTAGEEEGECEAKRQRRLEKNRASAALSRERKRWQAERLQQQVAKLENDNRSLAFTLSVYAQEITRLRQALDANNAADDNANATCLNQHTHSEKTAVKQHPRTTTTTPLTTTPKKNTIGAVVNTATGADSAVFEGKPPAVRSMPEILPHKPGHVTAPAALAAALSLLLAAAASMSAGSKDGEDKKGSSSLPFTLSSCRSSAVTAMQPQRIRPSSASQALAEHTCAQPSRRARLPLAPL